MQCGCIAEMENRKMATRFKTYSELSSLTSFRERFDYLKLDGIVGEETFGSKRWINQKFYHSAEYLRFRKQIIARDLGCDLGLEGHDIFGLVIIHHINPITYEDILNKDHCVLDPENAVCVSSSTHRAIHYGDFNIILSGPVIRQKNDTCPWK